MNVDILIDSLMQIIQLKCIAVMLIGIVAGFFVGMLPGIGGSVTLALMLSFIYNLTPVEAFAFLLGMHSVVGTTGDLTSILIGVPGEGVCAATILDGFPMAKKGEAGRAMGAALMSSLIGAVFGALLIFLSIPIMRPLVLLFGAPELLMLAVLGLSCISSLSGSDYGAQIKGFAAGCVGLIFAAVGQDSSWGVARYTFEITYLYDGIPLVPLLIGVFAFPEIIELAVHRTSIASATPDGKLGAGVWQGIKDTFTYWKLTIRCSAIGAWTGFLPGIGGAVSQWMAYAHAVQSARTPEEREGFGKGDVRGVIGPGASNNAKEGGALIPTLAFGVPGTPGMAILLGAFMIKDLVPGPEMLTTHLDVTLSMVWTLVFANIFTVLVCLAFVNLLAKLTTVSAFIIIPYVLLLVAIGSFTTTNNLINLVVTFSFGTLGYLMKRIDWPRAPLILGFVLGPLIESYLQMSMSRYDYAWMYRPGVITIFLLIVLMFTYPHLKAYWGQRKSLKEAGHEN